MRPGNNLRDRLKYAIDNTFSRGTRALILWLGIISFAIIGLIALVVSLLQVTPDGETPLGFWEAFWRSLMRALDAGTMGGDSGWGYRIAMLIVTIGGIFVISTLIGILSSGIEEKLKDLRKGRSTLIEKNHIIVLGWTEQIYTIMSELIAANANQKSGCIAVLGERDKVEMEEALKTRLGKIGSMRIVCRSGSPMETKDLNIVSINTARSIIVLSPDKSEDPDAEVIKTLMALLNHPERRKEPFHIIAELRDPKNGQVARMIGKDEVEIIETGEIVSRIIAQTCRQSGLSVVYSELLDFAGDEIYMKFFPDFSGRTYGELISKFNKNAVLGILSSGSPAVMNPPMGTIFTNQDQLIILAEDDDKINPDGNQEIQEDLFSTQQSLPPKPEKTLLLGWNWKAPSIIAELDHYVAKGSSLMVMASGEGIEETFQIYSGGVKRQLMSFIEGDITNRQKLESLDLGQYDHIILLCYSDVLSVQKADARTMISLLHLRDIAEKNQFSFSIVSEMLDIRNRNLAEVAHADDFIVSDKLIGLMMSQVSENKSLNSVFQNIFDPEGSEIYLKPVVDYVKTGEAVNFYTVIEAAGIRNETAIGYRLSADSRSAAQMYGVHLNPDKSARVCFRDLDKIIVLSEN
ncbi:MAG: potassium transporter TrkA [Chloroflexi bacterium]|nr:potassium transporter TrkA [Chloroflexota bacterium]